MAKTFCSVLLFLFLAASPLLAAMENPAGSFKTLQGTVSVLRQDSTIPAQPGMKIYVRDHIITGADGSAGIILQDNTIFSLGPDSRLALEEYVFAPDQGRFALLAKMVRGTFVYLSGVIGKLSPDSIKLETPVGTIAIRGTRFAAKIAGE